MSACGGDKYVKSTKSVPKVSTAITALLNNVTYPKDYPPSAVVLSRLSVGGNMQYMRHHAGINFKCTTGFSLNLNFERTPNKVAERSHFHI